MKIITDPRCTEYSSPGHPEKPQRISGTVEALRAQQEIAIEWLTPSPVEDEVLLRAHTADHVASLNRSTAFDGDTPAHSGIAEHARRSVGAGLRAVELAARGETVFSLMRPPGHHATKNQAMGFCYLNNIAIAALEAQARGFKKVAVFDFDVHHGNGTEDILLNRDGLAFFSIHQFPAYPGSGEKPRGNNCFNYPVPPDSPAGVYRAACTEALAELKRFGPDMVGVSAGFDSYRGDPLCQQNMEAADFHWLGKSLAALGVPLFSLLEGGYSRELPELIFAYLKGLNGKGATRMHLPGSPFD